MSAYTSTPLPLRRRFAHVRLSLKGWMLLLKASRPISLVACPVLKFCGSMAYHVHLVYPLIMSCSACRALLMLGR